MIYTMTFNPALDYVMNFKEIVMGEVNRSEAENIFIGGKGINVSLVLKELGYESIALGFVSGFTGKLIEEQLDKFGVKSDFVYLKEGFSRINVKIKSEKETDLNANGPNISKEKIDELFLKLEGISKGDTLVISGSVPKTMPYDIYDKILAFLFKKDIRFVIDTTGELLCSVLKYKPFLIKPNNYELGEIFDRNLNTINEIEECARKLKEMGAQNVLVSLAGNGALLIDSFGKTHIVAAANGKLINSVGAGDSMVAGFIAGYDSSESYEYALKLGSAAGSATAFSEWLANKDDIIRIFENN